jgi:PAS domain S-box-containing protein
VLIGASPVRDDAGRTVGILGFLSDVTERRTAEAALSRANERFALASDAVHSMIFEWDLATGTFDRSAGVFPITGYRPGDATNRRDWWLARIHPDDCDAYEREPVPPDSDGDRYEREYRIRHRDGRWMTVWEQGRVVRDEQGAMTRIIGSVTDISGRTAAERALRLLEEYSRGLASSLDYEETLQRVAQLSAPTLADWCFVDLRDAHGAVRRVAVAGRDDAPPLLVSRANAAEQVLVIHSIVEPVLRSGEALLVENIPTGDADDADLYRALSIYEPISLVCVPLRIGGEIQGALSLLTTAESMRVLSRDELSLAEQLARRAAGAIQNARLYRDAQLAEDRYRGLFEGTKDAMLIVDPEGICLDANPALVAMVGHARDELVGNPAARFVADGPWNGADWDQLRRDGLWQGDFDLVREDGAHFTIESWFTRVTLPIGAAYAGVLRDVSERRRFERMQEEFLSSLAHDLKNPLTALRGQTQLMLRRLRRGDLPEPDRLQTGLEGIDSAAIRMTKLLDELSDVTRLRTGQAVELDRSATDLVDLARRITEEYQRTTEKHTLVVEAGPDTLVGDWDGARLERVLGNLLGNAIKYSPRGGKILVRVERDDGSDGEALLSVQDHGVGIPLADRERIFERYQRAGNVDRFAGTGIGLAGARRIVELHGGTIAVGSQEGAGSTFVVRLPITAPELWH